MCVCKVVREDKRRGMSFASELWKLTGRSRSLAQENNSSSAPYSKEDRPAGTPSWAELSE